MRATKGFTLLELLAAIAIVGVLATLGYGSYQSNIEKSNFRTMQEFGVELALNQQLHRQRFGRYAQTVSSTGTPAANRLVMPSANKYQINVSSADFRGYTAQVKKHNDSPQKLPTACAVLIVESAVGVQRFGTQSATGQNTSEQCVPHG